LLVFGLLFVLAFAVPASAELATDGEMENVCQNWLSYIVSATGDWAGSTHPEIIETRDIIENDTLLARYFGIAPGGYIIVPALKELAPVKAYTDEYSLDIDEPGGFALMLREVLSDRMRLFADVYGSLEVSQPQSDKPLFDNINREKWNQLAVSIEQFAADKSANETLEEAGPLLKTAWHQNAPYNMYCPDGDGERCLVGCVATAAAQIVWYYAWPPYGQGSHEYDWGGDYSCGDSTPGQTLYADYSDPYGYDGSNAAMAELCYEMGVAYDMNYGACASGAWTMQGQWIYPYYFRYLDTTRVVYRDDYTPTTWFELIKTEINMRRPILYQIPRHAIVCDGWRVADGLNQYHFNYGWGGSQNAWFTVDNLFCDWDGCEYMYEVALTRIIPNKGIAWLREDGFSDASSGNGNGIYEAGETVEMYFTVTNFGGAILNDVSVTLSVDDASINIINGSTYFGSINALDSVTNSSTPFVFSIPADYIPRIDSFTLAISCDGGSQIDTVIFEQAIGTPSILLVDDDPRGNALQYYTQGLANYRIPGDIWEADVSSPSAADLGIYDMVIWFTGEYRVDPLDANEIAAMQGYMDGGGQLFLNGQAIAAQLATFDPGFLNNYLKATYEMTMSINQVPLLKGLSGQICDTSDMLALVSGSGAGNQEYPDLIDTVNGGIAELLYLGQSYLGGVSYSGDYNLIFLSFGFEAIVNGDYRWTYRDSLFDRILDFFQYQRPDPLPKVIALAVSPGDSLHLLDHTPELGWTYQDALSAPQASYQIQVGDDQDWSVAEMWDYGPISGEDITVVYDGLSLEDGRQYYFRVRANNGTLWSAWRTGQFRLNSAPSIPIPMAPAPMYGVISVNPILTSENASDGEADEITYDFELYQDSMMTTLIESVSDMPEGGGGMTDWQISSSLSEDAVNFWRVRGGDPFEEGQWSDLSGFWVNADNQAPTAFNLLTPEDESTPENSNPRFSWAASTDADLLDVISYRLYYGTDSTFAEATVISNLDTLSYIPPTSLPPATRYYWKVIADDLFGGVTPSNQVFSFSFAKAGDANGDGDVNVADAVYLINFVFKSGAPPEPYDAGDANCDATVNVGDAVYLITYVFRSGPEPGCL